MFNNTPGQINNKSAELAQTLPVAKKMSQFDAFNDAVQLPVCEESVPEVEMNRISHFYHNFILQAEILRRDFASAP